MYTIRKEIQYMKKSRLHYFGFLTLVFIIGLLLISISYSKFLYSGYLTGIAVVPSKQNYIEITDVTYLAGTNVNGQNSTINSFSHTNMDSTIILEDSYDSTITYQITITNNSNETKYYSSTEFINTDNPEITYEIEGLLEGKKLEPTESVTFYLTFKHAEEKNNYDNNTLNSEIRFNFTNVDSFPVVFNLSGPCIFDGSTGNISGENCTQYSDRKYIDTGIKLYDSTNYLTDYEIGITIDEYDPNNQDTGQQHTIMNDKLETDNFPGIVFRRAADNLEISQKIGNSKAQYSKAYTIFHKVQIIRRNNKVYFKIDDGEIILLQDMNGFNQFFDNTVWFGAAQNGDGDAFRHFRGTLSNLYIRMGRITDSTWAEWDDDSDSDGGASDVIIETEN